MYFTVVFILATLVLSNLGILQADELTDFENVQNCIDKHSCKNNSIVCKCDENCAAYGDCCSDSPYLNNSIPRQQTICNKDILLKVQCPPSWTDEAIRHKCENYYELSDPLSTVPVTSSDTANSYKNYYCAMCDGVTENFVFWTVTVKCPIYHTHDHLSVEYLRSHLQYNSNQDGWGIWLSSDRKVFRKCVFDYRPDEVEEKNISLRSCMNMVKDCPLEWTNKKVEKRCNDSFIPVFVGIVAYRNVHCAICHNIDLKTLTCFPQIHFGDSALLYDDETKLHSSKQESINVDFIIGSESCGSRQVYDPFYGKCRHVV